MRSMHLLLVFMVRWSDLPSGGLLWRNTGIGTAQEQGDANGTGGHDRIL
jgi:hypothetical protein